MKIFTLLVVAVAAGAWFGGQEFMAEAITVTLFVIVGLAIAIPSFLALKALIRFSDKLSTQPLPRGAVPFTSTNRSAPAMRKGEWFGFNENAELYDTPAFLRK